MDEFQFKDANMPIQRFPNCSSFVPAKLPIQ